MESQEDVQAHHDDLLCISWGSLENQLDCSWMFTRQSSWILMQLCNANIKVYAEKLTSCALDWIPGCIFTQPIVTDPRVTRRRHNHNLTAKKKWWQDTSIAWYKTTMTAGQDRAIACHSHPIGQCVQTKVTDATEPKCVLILVQGQWKSIQSCKDYYNMSPGSWPPIRTIQKSLRVTQMLLAISSEQ